MGQLSRTRGAIVIIVALLSLGAAGASFAQAGPPDAQGGQPGAAPPPTAAPPQGEYVPASSLPREELPAAPLVMGAYAFVWAALLVYVWTVWRRLQKVEAEVRDLQAKLNARQKS